jgi:hypothetical protein
MSTIPGNLDNRRLRGQYESIMPNPTDTPQSLSLEVGDLKSKLFSALDISEYRVVRNRNSPKPSKHSTDP